MSARPSALRGFTLIEVLVALVIVALGMSALLETLSASAGNIGALRSKSVAEWIAMNQIASVRLALTAPVIGTRAGDVRNCAHSDWHWQQQIAAVNAIPGLLSITVSVRRTGAATDGSASSGNTSPDNAVTDNTVTASGCIITNTPGSATGSTRPEPGLGPKSSFPDTASGSSAASPGTAPGGSLLGASSGNGQNWLITLTGFRGNSLAAASGEIPDWAGSTFAGEAGAGFQGNVRSRTAP